ncbi:MAG: hypothetical protein AAFX55_17195 [Bacteroidota bacterium]
MKKYLAFALLITLCSCNSDDDAMAPVEDPLVVAEFRTNLSELNLFVGDLNDLDITSRAFEYSPNTALFTDYAHKQRLVALPENTAMQYNGDGLPIFPENTVIAKTFYYNNDERNLSLGRIIIETRILIKINGNWETGNYKWNDDQTDATLDLNASTVPVTWINDQGETNSTVYKIPSDSQCFTCHRTNEEKRPIGLKLEALNFDVNGVNQIQQLVDNQLLTGVDFTNLNVIPNWDDSINYSLEERARVYFDINCAHCHTDGGYCESQSSLRLDYSTSLENTNIVERKNSIIFRVASDFEEGLTMPWIGTSMLHNEGVDLILEYLDTL